MNTPMPPPFNPYPVPARSSFGCGSFTCGCLVGLIGAFFLLFFAVAGIGFMAVRSVDGYIPTLYKETVRPEIAGIQELPAREKQEFLREADALMSEWPNLSYDEKATRMKAIYEKYETQFKQFQEQLEREMKQQGN